jgi:hypothetical protein
MTITLAKAWCPESGRECFTTWQVAAYPDGTFALRSTYQARCPECLRWLRPRLDASHTERLPHHLPEKPRRGR